MTVCCGVFGPLPTKEDGPFKGESIGIRTRPTNKCMEV